MLIKLENIEEEIKALLLNNTAAGENVFINEIDPINAEEEEGSFVLVYFSDDSAQSHNQHSSEYDLKATYSIECLVASKDAANILKVSRSLASQAQQILISNPEGKDYFDLRYVRAAPIKQEKRSILLLGWKLDFEINYLAGIL